MLVRMEPRNATERTDRSALLAEAQQAVAPMMIVARQVADGFVSDLVSSDGRVIHPLYGAGPDEVITIFAAEQRYLVEQEGRGSVAGATYVDKARERIRRGPRPPN